MKELSLNEIIQNVKSLEGFVLVSESKDERVVDGHGFRYFLEKQRKLDGYEVICKVKLGLGYQ